MRYDLTDLRLFLQAVAAGSFSEGARRANISISALSERMKNLEIEAGTALFLRRARGSELTPAGQEFALLARSVLLQAERLEGTVASWRSRLSGSIRLLTNSNAISSFLPEILARFLVRYPDVELTVREAISDDIAHSVRMGEADLGVVAGTADLDGLSVKPFRTDRLIVLVPVGHRLAKRRRLAFAEIVGEPFIGLNEDAAIERYLNSHAVRLGRTMNSRIRLRSFDGIARVVAANAGIAIVPASVMARPLDLGTETLELSDPWARRDLVICRLPVRPRPEVARLEEELTAADTTMHAHAT